MNVCNDCIGDTDVEQWIRSTGRTRRCAFCKNVGLAVKIEELAAHVDPVFRMYFEFGPSVPSFDDDSDRVYYEQEGDSLDDLISEILVCDDNVASEVSSALISSDPYDPRDGDEPFYSSEALYAGAEYYGSPYWEALVSFRDIIKHKRRFFIDDIAPHLSEIFTELQSHKTEDGRTPIASIAPDELAGVFYRGRIVSSDHELSRILINPSAELGPPPPSMARAGRMNPAGIPVFYGAYDRNTCIVELRPPAGSRVVTGKFKLCKPITILDLTVFDQPMDLPGIFADPDRTIRLHQMFMREFHDEIAKPILPCDEAIDYIITQVISEYLSCKLGVTGLVYRSAQSGAGSKNIVLFRDASFVKRVNVNTHYDLGADSEDTNFVFTFDTSSDRSTPYVYVANDAVSAEELILEYVPNTIETSYVKGYTAHTENERHQVLPATHDVGHNTDF